MTKGAELRARAMLAMRSRGKELVWPPKGRWTFGYGLHMIGTVTVKAREFEEAATRARRALDHRYMRANKEAPVAHTLALLEMELAP